MSRSIEPGFQAQKQARRHANNENEGPKESNDQPEEYISIPEGATKRGGLWLSALGNLIILQPKYSNPTVHKNYTAQPQQQKQPQGILVQREVTYRSMQSFRS